MDADDSERVIFQLPVGTVTFMLTDIEGSARLWESDPEAMGVAVARHYELLDAAIVLHGGVRPVEQGEGDSVVAVFVRASDALAAALDVQRSAGACVRVGASRSAGGVSRAALVGHDAQQSAE